MCLAIYQAPGVDVPLEHLENGWVNNPDGGGFAYIDRSNTIQMFRTQDWDDWLTAYADAMSAAGDTSPFLIHFRIATHGSKTLDNVHPFVVPDHRLVAVHNGIIPVNIPKGDQRSDTRFFCEEVLPHLPRGWLDNDGLHHMVSKYIGGSKMVFLTTDPDMAYRAYITNMDKGTWDDNDKNWYSNTSYRYKKSTRVTHYGGWGESGYRSEYVHPKWGKLGEDYCWRTPDDNPKGASVRHVRVNVNGKDQWVPATDVEVDDRTPRSQESLPADTETAACEPATESTDDIEVVDERSLLPVWPCFDCEGPVDEAWAYCTVCSRCQFCDTIAMNCMCWNGERWMERKPDSGAVRLHSLTDEEWAELEAAMYPEGGE